MNGNRVAMERSDEGRTDYSYDSLNQLVEAKFPGGDFQRFDYDPVGNRMKLEEAKGITTYAYDPANEIQGSVETREGGVITTSYSFDAAGNMASEKVEKKATKYAWDANNRLVQLSAPNGQKETVTYDPFNHRLSKKGKATTYYSWDGNLCVYDTTTYFTDSVMYVPLNGEIVAQVGKSRGDGEAVSQEESEPVRYYHTDALGSVLALSGKSGNVLATYSYEPYGAIRHQEGASSNANTYVGGYGVRNDSVAGYYMVNRYQNYFIARFISEDMFEGDNKDNNIYRYVINNPMVLIDPYGLYASGPCKGQWIFMKSEPTPTKQMFNLFKLLTPFSPSCDCYWLCKPCDKPIMYDMKQYYTFPKTTGILNFTGTGKINKGWTCDCVKPSPDKTCNECNK
jgi:RHS repeat-associated protein